MDGMDVANWEDVAIGRFLQDVRAGMKQAQPDEELAEQLWAAGVTVEEAVNFLTVPA